MKHEINGHTITVDLRPKKLTKEEADKLIKVKTKKEKQGKIILKEND